MCKVFQSHVQFKLYLSPNSAHQTIFSWKYRSFYSYYYVFDKMWLIKLIGVYCTGWGVSLLFGKFFSRKQHGKKKVLLREQKRHTARGMTCPSATYPGEGVGVPHPVLAREVPHPVLEVSNPLLARGYPILTWPGGIPYSSGWMGPHPVLAMGVPPS